MKKLASIIGVLVCWAVMDQPKKETLPRVVNNYYISKSGGCSGSCGGNCKCGGHHD